MMNKLLLINQSSGYLMIDIVNAFEKKYDEVVFMYGSLEKLDLPLSKNVKISKLIVYNRKSALRRAITWVVATMQVFFRILFVYRNHEIVYVTNPPLIYLISLIIKRPFSIIVYDTYPDALKNFGIKESNIAYMLWVKWNKIIFAKSKVIFTLSEGMKRCLTKYIDEKKINVIPNWSHSDFFYPIPKSENKFIIENNLIDKFIVLYSGNIGFTHNVEVIIEIANLLSEEENIQFLIIGEGGKKKKIMQMAKDNRLTNCTFLTWQTTELLPFSLGSADLGIVTINNETALLSVPSKTYHLMAVGAPLLCIAPKKSELNELIIKHNNGICFEKDQLAEIANYIIKMKNNPKERIKISNNSISASYYYTELNALKYVEGIQ